MTKISVSNLVETKATTKVEEATFADVIMP